MDPQAAISVVFDYCGPTSSADHTTPAADADLKEALISWMIEDAAGELSRCMDDAHVANIFAKGLVQVRYFCVLHETEDVTDPSIN